MSALLDHSRRYKWNPPLFAALKEASCSLQSLSGERTSDDHHGLKSTFVCFGPKADKCGFGWNVRYVPKGDIAPLTRSPRRQLRAATAEPVYPQLST